MSPDTCTMRPRTGPTVLLFSSLALSFDATAFAKLRKKVAQDTNFQWMLDVITELPDCCSTVAASLQLDNDETQTCLNHLEDLERAFELGQPLATPFPLPNKLLLPLVVISQLIQYADFLQRTSLESDGRVDVFANSKQKVETLGLCTGLLAAFTVSSTASRDDFARYGTVSIRLAVAIGMVADMETNQNGSAPTSRSLGTEWSSVERFGEMQNVLRRFPDAYISVNYDHNRATITADARSIPILRQQLKAAGVTASEIGLYGRYHTQSHECAVSSLTELSRTDGRFQFIDASNIIVPTRSNVDGSFITEGPLHHHALRSILVDKLECFEALDALRGHIAEDRDALIISIGPEKCIPPSLKNELAAQVVYLEGPKTSTPRTSKHQNSRKNGIVLDTDIAVVGMACKVAGADNLEEFWDLLCSGQSQHREVPKKRFGFETAFRDVDPKRKWFGNFINGPEMFDHKFFKVSPRESATMDPQQRHLLQVAYQAVEQSGYFQRENKEAPERIGCYIGLCGTDYEHNIACHAPNAFSATGNLEGFAAGKISHYFGWTGPALIIDTACSSSAVAIHHACQSIINGECTAALAGGTHIMTSPLRFQNLAGASFLSQTGQCKPFDSKADGYCRGDAVATVFLKKASVALADEDQILGIIAGTGVQQNRNCTPIFVPNASSLSSLFEQVTRQAHVKPDTISVVEAHGTGTAVGDPAEYDSIRTVLGGPQRTTPLVLGSVKGFIGHTEPVSGVLSLIKILLMMKKGSIPPQASFKSMNPAIKAQSSDNIVIPTKSQPWETPFRAALVNNYGASGSNASIVITQPPCSSNKKDSTVVDSKYPFWLCGGDNASLRRYAAALKRYVARNSQSVEIASLSNLSFSLARQSNRNLSQGMVFSAKSVADLQHKLSSSDLSDMFGAMHSRAASPRPVVFCFGGQVNTFVGLDKDIYSRVSLLRKHIDDVDVVARRLGAESIFPDIFEREPVQDIVKLQTMLFATQYACARSWIDSGVNPVAVVGHSFGELTALCVSNILSLEDMLKAILGRATLIRDAWGQDKGAMMAVEGDLEDVQELANGISRAADDTIVDCSSINIACYNGPRSFTLAGSTTAIDAAEKAIELEKSRSSSNSPTMRFKRLDVTNAFHCALVDPLMKGLEQCGDGLTFRGPKIPMERAVEHPVPRDEIIAPNFFAEHMRSPVYFNHALQRLAQRYSSCIFLEAGSNSTITTMASRALGNSNEMHFQGVNITGGPNSGWNGLVYTTLSLWKAGLNTQFWGHHGRQTAEHAPLLLPPYQFEQARHWVDLKVPNKVVPIEESKSQGEKVPEGLLTLSGYRDEAKRVVRFRVNTMTAKYDKLVSGHIFANTAAICPATVQLDLVIEALRSLEPELVASGMEPQLHSVQCQSPVCVDSTRVLWIELTDNIGGHGPTWTFEVFSTESSDQTKPDSTMTNTIGSIVLRSTTDVGIGVEFSRLERLVSHKQCLDLLNSGEVDESLQARSIYKIFTDIVDYAQDYRGVQKLVGKGDLSAGYVVRQSPAETWMDSLMADYLCQVAGIWANCMTDCSSSDMFVCNGMEQWFRNPALGRTDSADGPAFRPEAMHVLAMHHRPSPKAFLSDIFAFDATSGKLLEVVTGISYVKVSRASMRKLLTRLTPSLSQTQPSAKNSVLSVVQASVDNSHMGIGSFNGVDSMNTLAAQPKSTFTEPAIPTTPKLDVRQKVKAIVADLSGLELNDIQNDSELADLGIDSLLGMELAHEISTEFGITIPDSKLMEITDLPGLVACVAEMVGVTAGGDRDTISDAAQGDDASPATSSLTDSSDAQTATSTPALSSELEVGGKSSNRNAANQGLQLSFSCVCNAFEATKVTTDDRIVEYGQENYASVAEPLQTQLCVALLLEAFDELGSPLRNCPPDQELTRIPHAKEYERLVDALYLMLEKEAHIIRVDGKRITRTAVPASMKSSDELLHDLLTRFPDQNMADKLTQYAGSNLADVLRGKTDGIKLIFGCTEGREMVSHFYAEWPLHRLLYRQLENFLGRLTAQISGRNEGPLKILEMGAGTGGTTKLLLPLLAAANIAVEYTFTDLAPSFVAAARKKFKEYPFLKFRTHNIENVPADDMLETQHIIIASNAVHATRALGSSTANIRRALRPDGFLLLVEMTDRVSWMDLVFGLFEGWWLFDDNRSYVVSDEHHWREVLQSVGYGHVDWTDGQRAENKMEKLIIAMASESTKSEKMFGPPCPVTTKTPSADLEKRQVAVERYIHDLTDEFAASFEHAIQSSTTTPGPSTEEKCVLVTGATGSLGSHLAAALSQRTGVKKTVCLNRRGKLDPRERQFAAFTKRSITLPYASAIKVAVLETDLSKPSLGLPPDEYEDLVASVTHIVHNAWPMNTKWPLHNFKPQLKIMSNMLDLARDIASRRPDSGFLSDRVTFQFVSSVAAVGHWPIHTGEALVPEERMSIESVLPMGYGDAKHICERMLDETLHRYPRRFRAMVARPGQIAAASATGYWNSMEHIAFLIKSSQTLKALPLLPGHLAWTPVDAVAGSLIDLLFLPAGTEPHPIYHIDNPHRQPWETMIHMLATALDIPISNILSFPEWLHRVREHSEAVERIEGDNPASILADFFERDFEHMSCGAMVLGTEKSCSHSPTLARLGPVGADLVELFIKRWKNGGFLTA